MMRVIGNLIDEFSRYAKVLLWYVAKNNTQPNAQFCTQSIEFGYMPLIPLGH